MPITNLIPITGAAKENFSREQAQFKSSFKKSPRCNGAWNNLPGRRHAEDGDGRPLCQTGFWYGL